MALSKVTAAIAEIPSSVKLIGGTVVAGAVLITVLKKLRFWQTERKEYPPDTIVICQMGRGPYVPSLTPFAIKLETYLRLEGIPYEVEHNLLRKSKKTGKVPFLLYNGEEVCDSEFILEFLSKAKQFDLHKCLTSEQIAIGRAFQKMAEENTYWCFVADRWILDKTKTGLKELGLPRFLWWKMQRTIKGMIHAQGIGRHTPEEINYIMSEDLKAISDFIGTKKFLFGDKACKFDCAIFGILAEIRWASFGGFGTSVIKNYPNLCDYCERMKNTFWPDWNEKIQRDCTK
ncbi:failed axon connections homolog [Ylistrum balloti]|uniref:failed axon connections homolog n=1 Tax=Ylistrum balloti TaxID=509963 RepID=UPI0029058F1B|nr:failed axon connections homolog [Ylistrum balloti]